MLYRLLGVSVLVAVATPFTSCSGSGSATSNIAIGACGSNTTTAFCLVSCNLGCTSTTCDLTEIAQNQPIRLVFNQNLDPASVNLSSIALRTRTGEEPTGQWVVDGPVATFVPDVRTIEGQNFFGFAANQEYLLTILGGTQPPVAIRSVSGDRLPADYRCTLRVSGGVVDLSPGNPTVQAVLSPAQLVDVDPDTTIVLRFNEIIDATAFLGTTTIDGPIQVRVRKTAIRNGQRECDPLSRQFPVDGPYEVSTDSIGGFSTWTFRPFEPFPSGSCVEVQITSRVRDFANNSARPQVIRFLIRPDSGPPQALVEEFDSSAQLDLTRSSGDWSNGIGSFGAIGGDGRHGDFDINDGTDLGGDVWEFSTDSQPLAPKDTMLGNAAIVNGGEFHFTRFVVPQDITVKFVGSNPARIFVRGEADIRGTVTANGVAISASTHYANVASRSTIMGGAVTQVGVGQDGSAGGPGGGAGGTGAFACDGTGNPINPAFNDFGGFGGETVQVPMTHLGANDVGNTGGKGGALLPAHGDHAQLTFMSPPPSLSFLMAFVPDAPAFGGGGGFGTAGVDGIIRAIGQVPNLGQPVVPLSQPVTTGLGGGAFDLYGYAFTDSVEHFLVGGSGGGGGGSGAMFALVNNLANGTPAFWSGAGGAGGGGAVLVRAGQRLLMSGSVQARGGESLDQPGGGQTNRGVSPSGGGGSGGSVLLQSGNEVDFTPGSLIDVSGGDGSRFDNLQIFYKADLESGAGAPGVFRLEVPGGGSTALFGMTMPAAQARDVGELRDSDALVGFQSKWYDTGATFPPNYIGYEIVARIGGSEVTFRDDVIGNAAIEGQPLRVYFQGGDIDRATGEPDPASLLSPWVRFVSSIGLNLSPQERGLASFATTGLRYQILVDRAVTGGQTVEIESLKVLFRE